MKGYEFFDHTADIGIRASGRSLAELLTHMADGLRELLVEDSEVRPAQAREISLTADDAEGLLLAWLQELLFWFSAERFLPAAYELTDVAPTSLTGRVRGERFDPKRHAQGREVKAITRHQLQARQVDGAWHGQVIVDI